MTDDRARARNGVVVDDGGPADAAFDRFDALLEPYAMRCRDTRGRRHPEPPHSYRTAFARDRDRIIHSRAFRRLAHKTQVFVRPTDDSHRNRLTHTLEVSQIARTVARGLGLNEDLTEAVALAHDLGHPPFAHAGERALARCMAGAGGFEHNLHGLRVVDVLERRYPAFEGLNLGYEVRESIALHSIHRGAGHPAFAEFQPVGRMLAESQTVDAADSIAYLVHDVEDALRAGLLTIDDLDELAIWRVARDYSEATYGPIGPLKMRVAAALRALIDLQTTSLLVESRLRLKAVDSPAAVRGFPRDVVDFDAAARLPRDELRDFLLVRVYRHPSVVSATQEGEALVESVFRTMTADLDLLPDDFRDRLDRDGPARVVCDYIAGMTDRYVRSVADRRTVHPSAVVPVVDEGEAE
ncbi:MAG: dGTP triphosphohydrolase [Planctomycetia bacterium]